MRPDMLSGGSPVADGNQPSSYLQRLARGRDLSELLSDEMLAKEERMRTGPGTEGVAVKPDVRGAIEAAKDGRPMDDAQRIATEAIIFPELRPALDIINDSYAPVTHRLWTHLSTNSDIKSRL